MNIPALKRIGLEYWAFFTLIGVGVFSFVWMISRSEANCKNYYPSFEETVSYAELLDKYSIGVFDHPFLGFLVFNVVGVVLLLVSRRYKRNLFCLFLLMEVVCCLSLLASFLSGFCDFTSLQGKGSVEVDGHSYRLVKAHTLVDELDNYDSLILFECDSGGAHCHGFEINKFYFISIDSASLSVENNQLIVYANGEVVFTVEVTEDGIEPCEGC